MNIQSQIIELYNQLSLSEQGSLLSVLAGKNKQITVTEFAQFIQKMYKVNVEFEISIIEQGQIKAIVNTPYGSFWGIGSNKTLAKADAVQKAFAVCPYNKK